MTEEVLPNIFRTEIPLPGNPLKAINSYLIRGEDRFLMIDTGMNREECLRAMRSALHELNVDLKRTDFFITHIHADHLGLVSELAQETSKVYFNAPDAEIFQNSDHWKSMASTAARHGFPEADVDAALKRHPGRMYRARGALNLILLKEGDILSSGPYVFHCVSTPGHTRGHMCLYEPRTKIFFAGDHVLDDITPNISLWSDHDDPLREYLASLDKVNRYEIARILPGHRRLIDDPRRRIAELKRHHEIRAAEVLSILRKGRQTAYQVASQMTWDIDCRRWEDFPLPQRWFATGEALAHLQYLQGEGKVLRETIGGKAFFFLTGKE
jgi:glyoxylase-like metal-dependent hydrolase (beta-lactamase superfamily II)